MDKFEYYTYTYEGEGFFGGKMNADTFQAELNRLGSEGWELVSCVPTSKSEGYTHNLIFIFKRKIQ